MNFNLNGPSCKNTKLHTNCFSKRVIKLSCLNLNYLLNAQDIFKLLMRSAIKKYLDT